MKNKRIIMTILIFVLSALMISCTGSDSRKIRIDFETGIGSGMESIYIIKGIEADLPEPEAEGWEFWGWYLDAGFMHPAIVSLLDKDTLLYAKMLPKRYTATYKTGDGKENIIDNVLHGEMFENKTVVRKGYDFGGWFCDKELTYAFDFGVPASKSICLYAMWIKLPDSFAIEFFDGDKLLWSYDAAENSPLIFPDAPQKEGMRFLGWTDESGNVIESGVPASRSMTLRAKWEIIRLTVSLIIFEDNAMTFEVDYMDTVPFPDDVTRRGYRFTGWFMEEDAINSFDPGTGITRDLTLYAGWEKTIFEITLIVSADRIIVLNANFGETLLLPADIEVPGFDFAGWYTDSGFSIQYDMAAPVESDFTLYAKWSPKVYFRVRVFDWDGTLLFSEMMERHTEIKRFGLFIEDIFEFAGYKNGETAMTESGHTLVSATDFTAYYSPGISEAGYFTFINAGDSYSVRHKTGAVIDSHLVLPPTWKGKEVKRVAGATSAADAAFGGCGALSVYIPSTYTSIGDFAFCSSLSLETIIYSQASALSSIGKECFSDCIAIRSVSFPDSLSIIDSFAFRGCHYLEDVYFGTNFSSFGIGCLDACISLENIGVSAGNTRFRSVSGSLYSAGGKVMYKYALGKNDTHFVLPKDVSEIFAYAFGRAGYLETVSFEESGALKILGEYAFYACSGLSKISFPKTLDTIGSSCFKSCGALIAIDFGEQEKLLTVHDYAFSECTGLEEVHIPENMQLGSSESFPEINVFAHSRYLRQITVNDKNSFYFSDDGVLYSKDGSTLVIYPPGKEDDTYTVLPGTTIIAASAFSENYYLKQVTLPATLTSIGDSAFSYCFALKGIDIPASVESIGLLAFYYCNKLEEVSFAAGSKVSFIGDGAFYLCTALRTFHITAPVPPDGHGEYIRIFDSFTLSGLKIYVPVVSMMAYFESWHDYFEHIRSETELQS